MTDEDAVMNVSSVASAIVNLKAAEQAAAIQYAVADRVLDSERSQGDAAVKLIEAAQASMDAALGQVTAAISGELDVLA